MQDSVPQYAGFWRRFFAIFIDVLIILPVNVLIGEVIKNDFFTRNLVTQILFALYCIGFTSSKYQGTIGQRLLKIKVGDTQQGRLSVAASTIRYFFWLLPAWPGIIQASTPHAGGIMDKMEVCKAITEQVEHIACVKASGAVEVTTIYSSIVMIIGGLVYVISIVASKQKAGAHDLICKQRVFKKQVTGN